MKLFRHLSAYLTSIFDQPGGIPQLDSEGNLVGPIIFSEENEADILGRTGASGEVVRAADTGNLWAYDDTNGWVPAAPHATFNGTNILLRTPADAWYKFAVTELEEGTVSADWFYRCAFYSTDAGDSWADVRNGTATNDPTPSRDLYDGSAGQAAPEAGPFSNSYQIRRGVLRLSGLEAAADVTLSIWINESSDDPGDSTSDTPTHLFPASNTYDFTGGTATDAFKQLLTNYGDHSGDDIYYEPTEDTEEQFGGAIVYRRYEATIPSSWIASDGTLTVGLMAHADAENDTNQFDTSMANTIDGTLDGDDLSVYGTGIVEAV